MKVIVGAVSLAVVAAIAVAAFLFWIPNARSVAWADIVDALRGVNTVHMTGEKQLAFHVDKWIRRDPFAVYEHNWPLSPKTAAEASREYIWAGNAEKVYFYFPRRGNRATIHRGLPGNFMDDVLAPTGPSGAPGSEPPYRVVGRSTVDGQAVVIFSDAPGEKKQTELAVDPATKLTIRVRQFEPDAQGKSIVVTRLRLGYNQTPPAGIFDWTPPAGATIVDKRRPRATAR